MHPFPRWGEGTGVRGESQARIMNRKWLKVFPSPLTLLPSGERGTRFVVHSHLYSQSDRTWVNSTAT
jgi:hypothetical protein